MTTPHITTCPRCGYDLSGAHDAMLAAPAPEDTCSECGLHFLWSDVLSGHLHVPKFSHEHGAWFDPCRLFATAARAMLGWPLWTRLRMVHDIRPARLIFFVLLSLLFVHQLAALLAIGATRFGTLGMWEPRAQRFSYAFSGGRMTPVRPPPPTEFLYSIDGVPVTFQDLFELALWPYDTAPGLQLASGARIGIHLSVETIFACLFTQLGTPILLLSLRQTRRQFRLRPLHVLRAMCLGVPFYFALFVVMQVVVGTIVMQGLLDPWDYRGRITLTAVGTTIVLTGQILWWWCFARAYLRAPHALGISLAGSILSGLLCVLVALLANFRLLYDLLT